MLEFIHFRLRQILNIALTLDITSFLIGTINKANFNTKKDSVIKFWVSIRILLI